MNKIYKFYKYPKYLQRNTIFNYEIKGGAERRFFNNSIILLILL